VSFALPFLFISFFFLIYIKFKRLLRPNNLNKKYEMIKTLFPYTYYNVDGNIIFTILS